MQETFARIYASGDWTLVDDDGAVSRSGLGSNLEQTEALRSELPALLAELGAESVLDIPCGDLFWMSRIDLGVDRYIGADIVADVIRANEATYGGGRTFRVLDLRRDDLPRVDVIFSRDCLVHLSNAEVALCLRNIVRSGSRYLATTIFTDRSRNEDIAAGEWRPLNLCLPPFGLPAPIRVLNEACTEEYRVTIDGHERLLRFADKSIGVWRIADLVDLV